MNFQEYKKLPLDAKIGMLKTYMETRSLEETSQITGQPSETVEYCCRINRAIDKKNGRFGGRRYAEMEGKGTLKPEEILKILSLFDECDGNATEIGRRIGRSHLSVGNILKANGLKSKGKHSQNGYGGIEFENARLYH